MVGCVVLVGVAGPDLAFVAVVSLARKSERIGAGTGNLRRRAWNYTIVAVGVVSVGAGVSLRTRGDASGDITSVVLCACASREDTTNGGIAVVEGAGIVVLACDCGVNTSTCN